MPTLSILITYHNEKELLTECIESILSQNPPPEEILVYDDASEFRALDYLPKDPSIRVIRGEKNTGPSRGRNLLLKEARGDYVHFHDADDLFYPAWMGRVRAEMDIGKDAIYTEVQSFTPKGEIVSERVLGLGTLVDNRSLIGFCIRHYMLVPAGTFKKRLIESVGGYRESLWQSEDFDFNVRVALTNPTFKTILEPLVGIRLRKESRSQNKVETGTFALQALMLLEKEVPHEFKIELAEKASEIGAELFRLGAREEGREAFETAKRMGPARYSRERFLYRCIARVLGQEVAENFGKFYRGLLPRFLREWISFTH